MIGFLASTMPEISIAPERLGHIGPLAVTNAQILGLVGSLVLLAVMWVTMRGVRRGSRSRFVTFIMWIFEGLYTTTIDVVGDKKVARKVFPLAVTLMFFFVINNWLELVPFLNAFTYDGKSVIRGAAADLNTTLGLAIVSMTTAQIWAIRRRGFFGNLGRYFSNPFKDFMHFFEGILEFVAEFSRTVALSFRIFGNIFGGEVLLAVMAYLTSYAGVVALPVFYVLEMFVGGVQGYVFYMLTIAFISLGLPQNAGHAIEGDPVIGTPGPEAVKSGAAGR